MQNDHGESPVVTDDAEPPSSLAQLTAKIVSAYVSNNEIALSDVTTLIAAVGSQMAKVGAAVKLPAEEKPEPAVPVRRSLRPDHLVCLICGKKQKLLKRHLAVEHGLTPDEYRQRLGLKPDYPMVAPNYAQQRRELALSIGLGRPKKPARRRQKSTARPAKADS
jgi:predicted transcriptional regulator